MTSLCTFAIKYESIIIIKSIKDLNFGISYTENSNFKIKKKKLIYTFQCIVYLSCANKTCH